MCDKDGLSELLLKLDEFLTKKPRATVEHTQKRQVEGFLKCELYYLSDGGYSRVCLRDNISGDLFLVLASESRDEVKVLWKDASLLREEIEKYSAVLWCGAE